MNQPDPIQNINIVKPVALERLGLHNFIINPLALSTEQRLLYSNLTKQLVSEYSNDTSLKSLLVDEYNTIVSTMTTNNELPPNYPIWNIIGF